MEVHTLPEGKVLQVLQVLKQLLAWDIAYLYCKNFDMTLARAACTYSRFSFTLSVL